MKEKVDYYFIGIGGVGMSALAEILKESGKKIAGSDRNENTYTKRLAEKGITVFCPQDKKNINPAIGTVVVSHAIDPTNDELIAAQTHKVPIITRSQLLGQMMDEKKGIAISGTHGKTTTTSMVSVILEKEGLDPMIANGGDILSLGGNAKFGKGEYFVAEACEYKRAFLDLKPYIAVITNIEADHLDYFKDLTDIMSAFEEFVASIRRDGFLVAGKDSPNLREIIRMSPVKTFTYGFADDEVDYKVREIKVDGLKQTFEILKHGQSLGEFSLCVPGLHNVLNATAATVVALELGVRLRVIKDSLAEFQGSGRRMEIKGEQDGVLVIDDYGHHPTEVRATLSALKSFYPNKKIWCVFQPHQYSRTKSLLDDFGRAFLDADQAIIAKIYGVRDRKEDEESISGEHLAQLIKKNGKESRYIEEFDDIVKYLKENTNEGDLVLTIGAGPVNEVAEKYLNS